ncbi:hypothetical protein HYS97_02465 [Candidatus Daviesbacteria bacterium]|nr:hypothetical protein [Candidatus Daviesbacteria bacterium]
MPKPEINLKEFIPHEKPIPEVSDVAVHNVDDLTRDYHPSRWSYLPMPYGEFPREKGYHPQAIRMPNNSQRFNFRRAAIFGSLQFLSLAASIEVMDVLVFHHITRQMTSEQALLFGAPWAIALGVGTAVYRAVTQGRRIS